MAPGAGLQLRRNQGDAPSSQRSVRLVAAVRPSHRIGPSVSCAWQRRHGTAHLHPQQRQHPPLHRHRPRCPRLQPVAATLASVLPRLPLLQSPRALQRRPLESLQLLSLLLASRRWVGCECIVMSQARSDTSGRRWSSSRASVSLDACSNAGLKYSRMHFSAEDSNVRVNFLH